MTPDQAKAMGEAIAFRNNCAEHPHLAGDIAAALLSAAGQWQTMESAPRDGTVVLCVIKGKPPLMLPMMWRDGFWWDDIDRGFSDAVTHWMHLPPPPETPEASMDGGE
jgi:hypothetical protein